MNFEFKKNPDTGILEAWEDGKVIGEFIPTGMMVKGWKLTDCIVRKEQRLCSELRKRRSAQMKTRRECSGK